MQSDYAHATISDHCLKQLEERNLAFTELKAVLRGYDEVLASEPGRVILHKVVDRAGKTYLWRVVIDIESKPPRVITAYITSKLSKYLKEH